MAAALVDDFEAVGSPLPTVASAGSEEIARASIGLVPGRFRIRQADTAPVLDPGLSLLKMEEEVRHAGRTGEHLNQLQKKMVNT